MRRLAVVALLFLALTGSACGLAKEHAKLDTSFVYTTNLGATDTVVAAYQIPELPGIGVVFFNVSAYPNSMNLQAQSAMVLLSDGVKVGDRVKLTKIHSKAFTTSDSDKTFTLWWARKLEKPADPIAGKSDAKF
jgi:hypothetical protein